MAFPERFIPRARLVWCPFASRLAQARSLGYASSCAMVCALMAMITLGPQNARAGTRLQPISFDTVSSDATWDSLYGLINQAVELGDYETAIGHLHEVLNHADTLYGAESEYSFASLSDLCILLEAVGRFVESIPYRERYNAWLLRVYGPSDPDYGIGLGHLGFAKYLAGDYGAARSLYDDALRTIEDTLGREGEDFGIILGNLGIMLQVLGDYAAAVPRLEEAIANNERHLGRNHVYTLDRLGSLAECYRNMGRYREAEQFFLEAIEQGRDVFGTGNLAWGIWNNNLAVLYLTVGRPEEAVASQRVSLSNTRANYGKSHAEYAKGIQNLARMEQALGAYDSARIHYNEAIALMERLQQDGTGLYATALSNLALLDFETGAPAASKVRFNEAIRLAGTAYGTESTEYAGMLQLLGGIYLSLNAYDSAYALYHRCAEIYTRTLGDRHPLSASLDNELGDLCRLMGRLTEARHRLANAEAILGQTIGVDHPEYAKVRNNRGLYYYTIGDYDSALVDLHTALAIVEQQSGPENLFYATVLGSAGLTYRDLGWYDDAERAMLRSVELCRKLLPPYHQQLALALNNLGLYYYTVGAFHQALPVLKEAERIGDSLQAFNPTTASYKTNLGLVYLQLGQPENALPYFTSAYSLIRKLQGEDHPDLAIHLNNEGLALMQLGYTRAAEKVFRNALSISRNAIKQNHQQYAISLNNLAQAQLNQGAYDSALVTIRESVRLTRSLFGTRHPDYALRLSSLAAVHLRMGQTDSAIAINERAVELLEHSFGKDNPSFGLVINDLGISYAIAGRDSLALEAYRSGASNLKKRLERELDLLSERQKAALVRSIDHYFGIYLKLGLQGGDSRTMSRSAGFMYDNELLRKGLLLGESRDLREALLQQEDSVGLGLFHEWTLVRSDLARQYGLPKEERSDGLERLEAKAEQLEAALSSHSAAYRQARAVFETDWQAVRDALEPGEIAVEFVRVGAIPPLSGARAYGALVVESGRDAPLLIELADAGVIDSLLERPAGMEEKSYVDGLYNFESARSTGARLYGLLLAPVLERTGTPRRLYYAPTGRLNTLSLAALPDSNGRPLSAGLELVRVTSTRNLMAGRSTRPVTTALLMGGVDYGFDTTSRKAVREAPVSAEEAQPLAERGSYLGEGLDSSRGGSWGYLPGTLDEVNLIAGLLKAEQRQVLLYAADSASEARFKAMNGHAPSLLHLSTHGFFYADPDVEDQSVLLPGEAFAASDNPLLRSGLVLAGGDYTWRHGSNPYSEEDGILTAYEIAQLDLSACELVVLSACRTGLGEAQGSEGVYGLQRAFKIAGAANVIMSLWRVPDRQTAELMGYFYKSWLSGETVEAALRKAQLAMSRKYSPYYWAAFVLLH